MNWGEITIKLNVCPFTVNEDGKMPLLMTAGGPCLKTYGKWVESPLPSSPTP